MRFEYEGEKYLIQFSRGFVEPKNERIPAPKAKRFSDPKPKPTTYPSTVGRIVKVIGPNRGDVVLFMEETVGCWHKDKFSKEAGRRAALGAISEKLSKASKGTPHEAWARGFNTALWSAYNGRIQANRPTA